MSSRKAALNEIVSGILHDLSKIDPTGLTIHILHADCYEDASFVEQSVRKAYPQVGTVTITQLGVVIGAHCGPGLLTVFYLCKDRSPNYSWHTVTSPSKLLPFMHGRLFFGEEAA